MHTLFGRLAQYNRLAIFSRRPIQFPDLKQVFLKFPDFSPTGKSKNLFPDLVGSEPCNGNMVRHRQTINPRFPPTSGNNYSRSSWLSLSPPLSSLFLLGVTTCTSGVLVMFCRTCSRLLSRCSAASSVVSVAAKPPSVSPEHRELAHL